MSLTKPKASEAQKSTIYEPSVAKLVEDNSKLRIKLMPHEHTLFCERKVIYIVSMRRSCN
jgi:hypothetical protein